MDGTDARHVWLGAESVLMSPLRWVLRFGWGRRIPTAGGGAETFAVETGSKTKIIQRLKYLQVVYVWLVVLDYRLQYQLKMFKARRADTVLCDRYFFDVAVNLAVTLGWSPRDLTTFLRRWSRLFVMPQVRCFVRIPVGVALERKDDVPAPAYLTARAPYYEQIAHDYGFTVLDGTEPVEFTAAQIAKLAEEALVSKTIFFVHSNNVDVGGADYCLERMAVALRDEGWNVMVSLRVSTAILDRYGYGGIPAFVWPFVRPQVSQGFLALVAFPFRAFSALLGFCRLFLVQKPDVVHVNDLYDFIPALAANFCGIPVVYHLRMIRVNPLELKVFGYVVSALSAISLSVSEAVKTAYGLSTIVGKHDAEVFHDWPDDRFLELGSFGCPEVYKSPRKRVVMVGRIDDWKGQDVFVAAVAQLKTNLVEAEFYLVGGSAIGPKKQKYAEEVLEEAHRVGVISLGERSDVQALLSWADVAVHASKAPDPFPGTVLESLLAGTATVAARGGGVPEVIRDGIDGLLVNPGDIRDLAEAMEKMLEDGTYREKLAASGRDRVLAIADKTVLVGQLSDLYGSLWQSEG